VQEETKQEEESIEQIDPDKNRTCGISTGHPFDRTKYRCGRPGKYLVEVQGKPCGHSPKIITFCEGCWARAQQTPEYVLACGKKDCRRAYKLMKHVVFWRRL
jgi:hypothetical protein